MVGHQQHRTSTGFEVNCHINLNVIISSDNNKQKSISKKNGPECFSYILDQTRRHTRRRTPRNRYWSTSNVFRIGKLYWARIEPVQPLRLVRILVVRLNYHHH